MGTALGISSLTLPRAVAAASGDESGGSGQSLQFSQSDQIIVARSVGQANLAFPTGDSTQSMSNVAGLTGVSRTMGLGGPYSVDTTALGAAESGITPLTDPRHWYRIKYQSASFNTGDPGAPFWRWTVVAGSPGLSLRAFVLGGFNASSSTFFSLRSSVDGYASSLRDFAGDGSGEYRRVVVDLSSLSRLGGNQSITFRLYVRRPDSSTDRVFLSGGSGEYAGLTVNDVYDERMGSWQMAYIGSV